MHFYRHAFTGLEPGTRYRVTSRGKGGTSTITSETLPAPPGKPRLRIGLIADLHLGTERNGIETYRPGVKRLYGLAYDLCLKYIRRLVDLGADRIILTGDIVDPCTPRTLGSLKELLASTTVACHPIIGNHEPWTRGGESLFYRELGLSRGGYACVRAGKTRLLLLSTPTPSSLDREDPQRAWLESRLEEASADEDLFLFSHFSLLLHPCVQGHKNDGYQLLDDHRGLLSLLDRHPNVRAFVAGHKNVPSLVVRNGVSHLLSPEFIQAPCGYDMLTLYDGGFSRTTYEIDEQHVCEVARAAYEPIWPERFGTEEGRSFLHVYA
jgi:3',5'-cyclic AMP phosphodiesterase CpdA